MTDDMLGRRVASSLSKWVTCSSNLGNTRGIVRLFCVGYFVWFCFILGEVGDEFHFGHLMCEETPSRDAQQVVL